MAKITQVQYQDIPGQAGQIRMKGQEINGEMTKAYNSIAEMHASWFGKRYDSLVTKFNEIAPTINELLDLTVGDIPFALETVANNYAMVDRGSNVCSANRTAPAKVANLTVYQDEGMKFLSSQVEATKSNVISNFTKAKEDMDVYETLYRQIEWESEAADAFTTKFQNLKREITTQLDDIEKAFNTLMTQTLADIESAESANTVS